MRSISFTNSGSDKERWYWIDKATIRCRFMIRLAFDPLTRRYRLSYNGLSLSFDTA
ncbi:MAG: DUF4390 domain-containing protein [Sutterella wadsworthensis]